MVGVLGMSRRGDCAAFAPGAITFTAEDDMLHRIAPTPLEKVFDRRRGSTLPARLLYEQWDEGPK